MWEREAREGVRASWPGWRVEMRRSQWEYRTGLLGECVFGAHDRAPPFRRPPRPVPRTAPSRATLCSLAPVHHVQSPCPCVLYIYTVTPAEPAPNPPKKCKCSSLVGQGQTGDGKAFELFPELFPEAQALSSLPGLALVASHLKPRRRYRCTFG